MITDKQKRQQILRKIYRIPSEKLNELDDFISMLENNTDNKSKISSYAGAWKNMDDSVMNDLTENLIKNRKKNKRRIDEKSSN
ncbi:MAG: hypothetical protein JXB49_26205 [Bacteroidales bacterium]|nr:hypothetical protein [Bacteroidales bacterium]